MRNEANIIDKHTNKTIHVFMGHRNLLAGEMMGEN